MSHVCIVLPPPVMIPPFGSTCAVVKENTARLAQATLRCKGAAERMQHGSAGAHNYFFLVLLDLLMHAQKECTHQLALPWGTRHLISPEFNQVGWRSYHDCSCPGSAPIAMGKRWAVPPVEGVYPNLPSTVLSESLQASAI